MYRNLESRQIRDADRQMQPHRGRSRAMGNGGSGRYEMMRGSVRPAGVSHGETTVRSQVEETTLAPRNRASLLDEPAGTVEIRGGEFSAAGGHRISVTINTADGAQSNPNLASTPRSADDEDSGTTETAGIGRESVRRPPTPPVQRSCDIYYRHMGAQGRGSPLWIPGPNKNLSKQYQRQGMGIGDVGILTVFGGFAFLFNICLPPDHPMQPAELPANFVPFLIAQVDIEKQSEFMTDSYLASASIERSRRDGDSSGLIFESSASEGAILTMPLGSTSEDLGNIIRLRRYVAANAASWYKYVYDVRGREVVNGDLRLVIGYDKTKAWGMATFANAAAHKDSFRLKFRPLEQTDVGRTYAWEYSGMAQVRAGPDTREMEALQADDPSQEQLEYENQCLFVRTMNVALPDKVWKELASELDIQVGLQTYNSQLFASPSTQGLPGNGESSASQPTPSHGIGASSSSRKADNIMPAHSAQTSSVFSAAMAGHPSMVINKMLLENAKTNVRMVITEDKDWISVLTKDDRVLPLGEDLCARVKALSVIREEEGIIFLEPKESQPASNKLPGPAAQNTSMNSAPPEFVVKVGDKRPSQQRDKEREREKSDVKGDEFLPTPDHRHDSYPSDPVVVQPLNFLYSAPGMSGASFGFAQPPSFADPSSPLTPRRSQSAYAPAHSSSIQGPAPYLSRRARPAPQNGNRHFDRTLTHRQSSCNKVTSIFLHADGMSPFWVKVDALPRPSQQVQLPVTLRVRLCIPTINDARAPLSLHGFHPFIFLKNVWSITSRCVTKVYQNGACISEQAGFLNVTHSNVSTVKFALPESSLNRCRWFDVSHSVVLTQEIIVDDKTLLFMHYELDRVNGGALPSAMLLGFQNYQAADKGTLIHTQRGSPAPSETKDFSKIPCEYFKRGVCSFGSFCWFSHSNIQPGGQKDICPWFGKGNCKFGNKCVLAHVIPERSMDTRNKKAAQTAADASTSGDTVRPLGHWNLIRDTIYRSSSKPKPFSPGTASTSSRSSSNTTSSSSSSGTTWSTNSSSTLYSPRLVTSLRPSYFRRQKGETDEPPAINLGDDPYLMKYGGMENPAEGEFTWAS